MIQFLSSAAKEDLPVSLESLSWKLRDLTRLRLADVKEIDSLARQVDISGDIKDAIDDWYLISLSDKVTGVTNVVLAGQSKNDQRPKVTSYLVAIDFEKRIAITHSRSAYAFGDRGFGELSPNLLHCVEAAIRTWDLRKVSP